MSFYRELCSSNIRNIAIVTHAGVIRIIKSIITRESIEDVFSDFSPEYGGVYPFEINH